jgi:hypothetical protein
VQRGGIDRFALAEEQQQALVGEIRGDVAVHAAVAVAFGEREEIVEVNEGQAGPMNQPIHLRKRQLRKANRRIHQASGARAHGPPGRMLRQVLLDLLLERRLRARAHDRIDMPAVFEE